MDRNCESAEIRMEVIRWCTAIFVLLSVGFSLLKTHGHVRAVFFFDACGEHAKNECIRRDGKEIGNSWPPLEKAGAMCAAALIASPSRYTFV